MAYSTSCRGLAGARPERMMTDSTCCALQPLPCAQAADRAATDPGKWLQQMAEGIAPFRLYPLSPGPRPRKASKQLCRITEFAERMDYDCRQGEIQ